MRKYSLPSFLAGFAPRPWMISLVNSEKTSEMRITHEAASVDRDSKIKISCPAEYACLIADATPDQKTQVPQTRRIAGMASRTMGRTARNRDSADLWCLKKHSNHIAEYCFRLDAFHFAKIRGCLIDVEVQPSLGLFAGVENSQSLAVA